MTLEEANALCADALLELIALRITAIEHGRVQARMEVGEEILAPNGFLHAAAVTALADTACGTGCVFTLGLANRDRFATIDLQCNFVGTAREGALLCDAEMAHGGRTTQVWDARVRREGDGKTVALFRCTQLLLGD